MPNSSVPNEVRELLRAASLLVNAGDYRGALDCFERASALLDEHEKRLADFAKSDAKIRDVKQQ